MKEEIANILKKLRKEGEEERTLETPGGMKRFKITYYRDHHGNEIIEIRGTETDDYILIPRKTLRQILREAEEP